MGKSANGKGGGSENQTPKTWNCIETKFQNVWECSYLVSSIQFSRRINGRKIHIAP